MSREIKSSYPVMVQAFQSPIHEEEIQTIEGCHRESCGAWGMGVCKLIVNIPEAGSPTVNAAYTSEISLLNVGCISCGDLDETLINDIVLTEKGSFPVDLNEDDETINFQAGGIVLPSAFVELRNETQDHVREISF